MVVAAALGAVPGDADGCPPPQYPELLLTKRALKLRLRPRRRGKGRDSPASEAETSWPGFPAGRVPAAWALAGLVPSPASESPRLDQALLPTIDLGSRLVQGLLGDALFLLAVTPSAAHSRSGC